ncbi:FAD synthetase [Millionella massiliensis]|uniref:FAD synthetase n=1 Tax=Millionella massiliensis TaxID=1871023 RepID=UPI0023A83C27|nr:FAD synthetase [Millionella massiliensis]
MQVHYGFDTLPPLRRTAVAVGSFDGVHRGHRLLIDRLNHIAHTDLAPDGQSVVVTFDPHPRFVLKGENRLLSTLPEKLELLGETGVDHVIVVHFTLEFSRIDSETFTQKYLIERLHAETVLSGEGHHFGHNRSGSAAQLEQDGIHTANLGRYENISSTAIRAAIEAGDMETAGHMLGGPYLIRTDTPHDPTKLLPPAGEYRVQVPGASQSEERMWIDSSLFAAPARYPRIRILGK